MTGNSIEAVALRLLNSIAKAEGIDLDKENSGWSKEKILATYQECLAAITAQEPPPRRKAELISIAMHSDE